MGGIVALLVHICAFYGLVAVGVAPWLSGVIVYLAIPIVVMIRVWVWWGELDEDVPIAVVITFLFPGTVLSFLWEANGPDSNRPEWAEMVGSAAAFLGAFYLLVFLDFSPTQAIVAGLTSLTIQLMILAFTPEEANRAARAR